MSELNTDNSVSDDNILNNQVQSVQQNNSYVSSSEDLNIPYNIFDSSDVMDTVDNNNIEFPNNIFLSWGRNDSGTLFRSEEEIIDGVQSLKFFGNRNIISISSNCYHSGAVTATGELYLCGSNEEGQSNPNRDNNGQLQPFVPKPRIIESLGQHRVCFVSCGLYHTACVIATGHAITFGGNEVGQLGHSSNQTSQVAPKLVDFKWKGKGSIAHKVSCGDMYSLFLATSGEIYSCGVGANTGHSNDTNLFHAERIETLVGVNVVYIVAGSSHSFAIASTGELYGWGSSQSGQLGMGDDSSLHYQIPIKIPLPANIGKVVGVSAGYSHSLIWVEKGSIHGCGSNKSGQVGLYLPKVSTFTEIPLHGVCLMAACGSNHSIAVIQENNNSKIYGWGSNIHGQITSTSTVTIYRQPTELTEFVSQWNINNVFYISAGGDQSYLIGSHNNQYFSNPNEFEFKMKKQFSTQASRAVVAMDASSLTKLINRAQLISESQGISHIELSSVLSITCELFSSPSLLAGSFINNQTALLLDINGIEECYKSLLSLGSTAIVRLNSAMLQALNELESNHLNLPESALRILVIIWQYPINSNAILSTDIFKKLLLLWSKLSIKHKEIILKSFLSYPVHLLVSRIIKPIQEHLTLYIESFQLDNDSSCNNGREIIIPIACSCLYTIYLTNNNIISKDVFYNESINYLSDKLLIKDFMLWYNEKLTKKSTESKSNKSKTPNQFFLCDYSFIMPIQCKRKLLTIMSSLEQQTAQQQSYQLSIQSNNNIIIPYLILNVSRNNLLYTTLTQLSIYSTLDYQLELKKPLKIIFDGEEGIDEGGVSKEFFQLLFHQLLSFDYGMFVHTPDQRNLWINKLCTWCEDEYQLIGILLGLALYNNILLDIHFPIIFYKLLLNQPIVLEDVISYDQELYNGLKLLQEYEPKEDVESVFCRTFEVTYDEFGEEKRFDLIPNGSNISVTHENRELYIEKYVTWLLIDSISSQFHKLYNGFKLVINNNSPIILVRPDELETLMIGTPHLDFYELENATTYISGDENNSVPWDKNNPIIKGFWEIVHNMAFEDKQKLLLFITGSTKAPIGGLKNLGMKIQRMCGDSISLPTSHTCFNVLLLPEYSSKDKLNDRLYKAISECEGFGLK